MKIEKLSAAPAFIAFDLDDAPGAGVTRVARKVLVDGAELLARSTTYAFASFGIRMGGASAGIDAEGDARDGAVSAFLGEVEPMVREGRWVTDPGTGLSEADLAALRAVDPRPAELWTEGLSTALVAQGAVAAAAAAMGDLTGVRAATVGGGPLVDASRSALTTAGAEPVDGGLDAEADLVLLAGKAGMVDHDLAGSVRARFVVPLTAVPVTARAHAVLSAAGVVHVPDFLSTAAPLLRAFDADGGDPVERVAASVAELVDHGTGLWMAAVERAEAFLSTWQASLPFGRPLA